MLTIGCGSPTDEISRSELLSAITQENIDAVEQLLENGFDVNVKAKGKGNSAASCSCKESGENRRASSFKWCRCKREGLSVW